MADVPLAKSDYFRGVAKEARILTKNRYFEANPVLTDTQVALLARMGLRRFMYIGDGPIRGVYSQAGSFQDAAFTVSGDGLWRVGTDGAQTFIGSINSANPRSPVQMAATSNIGTTPAFLYLCAGSTLFLYIENGYALGTITGIPANADVVRVDSIYYQFTNAGVNVGAPAGTLLNPWRVALGAGAADAWRNLANAIGSSGNTGVDYSSALLTPNPAVQVSGYAANLVNVRSNYLGALGNATVTTETGAAIAWGAGTLTGGGAPSLSPVQMPDDFGVISVGYIASYVVVVPAQGQDVNGRFYWIEPGETTVDPINFATAERAPDPINGVVVFGDQFWLPGTTTTEVWYFTGDIDSPVARTRGVVFDRGTWQGTGIQVKDAMIIVDSDGGVFEIAGGSKRISRPDIEERIRRAIQKQATSIFV